MYDPAGGLPEELEWEAAEGPQSYLVQVSEAGTHRIEVTHVAEDDGELVEATESAEFDIRPMVITVINITPGAMGVIDVEPGDEEPQKPIDLTGYWDFRWTPIGESELGPVLLHMQQTDSTLVTDIGFTGTISGSAVVLEAWMDMGEEDPVYIGLEGTVSGVPGSYVIEGEISGALGEGSFRMDFPSSVPFGRLDLEGEVDGVPVSLHTDYATGGGGETVTSYTHGFWLDTGLFFGSLRLETAIDSTGSFWVSDEPFESDQVSVSLWDGFMENQASDGEVNVTFYDGSSMEGTFDLSFPDASKLSGSFDVNYDTGAGWSSVSGTWQGNPVPYIETSPVYPWKDVWMTGEFELCFSGPGLNATLWMHVDGALGEGTYQMPEDQWWMDFTWSPDEGPGFEEIVVNDTGTLTITRFVEGDGIAGSFDALGGDLVGSFDVSFWEGWQPE